MAELTPPQSGHEELPLPRGRVAVTLLVSLGLLIGTTRQAQAAGRPMAAESPAQRITRLRAEAARVQPTIEQMNTQVEILVERYDANREALGRTQAAQVSTQRQIERVQVELRDAQQQLDQRVWAIYATTGGLPAGSLAELVNANSMHELLTVAKYQENVVASNRGMITRVAQAKHALDVLATKLASQRGLQGDLQAQLCKQHQQIERQLGGQRAYLTRLTAEVRKAVEEERRRQEQLRRQAITRRLAALRAARLRAPRPMGAARRAVAFALSQLGKPYQWGATGPDSYDCSGLTQTAYRYAGVTIPRVAAAQWYAGTHVSMGELQAGDLVFFATNLSDTSTIHHVGMYIGRGLMVEAPFTGSVVRTSSVGRDDYIGATRPTG